MAEGFAGKVEMLDSTPDWRPFLAQETPEGSPTTYTRYGLAGEELCVGYDSVSKEYRPKFEFSGGTIHKVVFDVPTTTTSTSKTTTPPRAGD